MINFPRSYTAIFGLLLGISISPLPTWAQDPAPKTEAPGPEALQDMTVLAAFDARSPCLHFDWGEKKPALAVVKGGVGKWWIVFDDRATVSLPDLKEHPLPGLVRIDVFPTKEGVVLDVVVDSHRTPVITQKDHKWQVSFKLQPLDFQESAAVQLPQTKQDGFVVQLKGFEKEIRFKDPRTGYTHVVFPSHEVGFGMAESQSFPEFHISATAQGIGFQLLKDDMVVNAASEQVTITHPDGLAMTLREERDRVRIGPIPTGFFADAKDLDREDRQQKINGELLDLPHDQHGPGELEIAWLLLSDGQAAEALGYLAHLAQMRPSIANVPLFEALRGVGNLVLNRWAEAERALSALPEDPEVQVWLSLAIALQRPHHFAKGAPSLTLFRPQFQRAKSMLQSYPEPLRHQMVRLILMACLAIDDLETLAAVVAQETRPENGAEREVFDLARASVLMRQHKPDAALQILGELMEKAVSPDVRDIARFQYVVHRLEAKMMTEADALPQLEHLRFQGRGWLGSRVATYLAEREAGKTLD